MVMDNSDVDFYENLLADQVIPDTYTSLPRGRRGRRRNHDFQTQPNTTEYLYGTYRRSKPYTNFATTAFDDEFRTPLNPTNDHHLNGTNNVIAKETNTYQQHQSPFAGEKTGSKETGGDAERSKNGQCQKSPPLNLERDPQPRDGGFCFTLRGNPDKASTETKKDEHSRLGDERR